MTLEEALARIAELEAIVEDLQAAQTEFAEEGEEGAAEEGEVVTPAAEDAVDDITATVQALVAEVQALRAEIVPNAPAEEGLNFSERGAGGTAPRAQGRQTADQRLQAAKTKGLTGLAAVKAGLNLRGR